MMKQEASTSSGTAKKRPPKKMSEYGKQLLEKQKVKRMYGVREKQFRRFFTIATKKEGVPGENLLGLLELRLDNVVYRLKLAETRPQARQAVVHGHIYVDGKKVHSPSYIVTVGDLITLSPKTQKNPKYIEQVVDKRLNIGIKVPEWLELQKEKRSGKVLREPVRSDIKVPIEEHLIIELYSK
jgi:small subunit ribosomal protein S4